jgi:hypothetical protein
VAPIAAHDDGFAQASLGFLHRHACGAMRKMRDALIAIAASCIFRRTTAIL